ncbi:MAG: hypothetical protein GY822_06585 [Deltaproteobacteria bacterium]|nr:hypothetical protein [Deltaproteobacteria bacterium]
MQPTDLKTKSYGASQTPLSTSKRLYFVMVFSLLWATGCRPPYAKVEIQDPFLVGDGVVEVRIGTGPGSTTTIERPANASFPMGVTVTIVDGERREVYVEVADNGGEVLANGTVEVVFDRASERTFLLELQTPCTENADCVDTVWCNGVESCVDGKCQSGNESCPSVGVDDCIIGNSCDEVGHRCVAELDHSLCPAELIGGIVVPQYCDASKGCTEGSACSSNTDCNDGVVCNGVESCVNEHCINGVGEQFGDDNPCTLDACIGDGEEFHQNVPDGNSCDLEENGICIEGLCTPSFCGDGFFRPHSSRRRADC